MQTTYKHNNNKTRTSKEHAKKSLTSININKIQKTNKNTFNFIKNTTLTPNIIIILNNNNNNLRIILNFLFHLNNIIIKIKIIRSPP